MTTPITPEMGYAAGARAGDGNLQQRLRALVRGFHEWRVENPQDGSYCISFTRDESHNPEQTARDWLADHAARFPESKFAGYVVTHYHVMTEKDKALAEAADALDALHVDAARYRLVRRGQHWSVINGIGDTLSGDALDAAADAKLAASPSPATAEGGANG